MELLKQNFDKIKKSNKPEVINDFLIKLSENPNIDHLNYLKYFVEYLDPQILDKIKLNLIFVMGEIGNLAQIQEEDLRILEEIYYKSDRWIRNEVIQAIDKISKNTELDEKTIELISNALLDEYSEIKINTLKLLSNFKKLPDTILKNLIRLMNSRDSEVLEGCRRILKRIPQQPERIFNFLNTSDNYQILKPRGIRSLLLIQFQSVVNTELFREMILNSSWDDNYREKYIKEINTFERILIKNI
ncbi:MAG: hypothetical protein ACFFFT_10765 [Candidatus Thorarchaeota archaeon]